MISLKSLYYIYISNINLLIFLLCKYFVYFNLLINFWLNNFFSILNINIKFCIRELIQRYEKQKKYMFLLFLLIINIV